jgi:flagellar P-ring protein precursor FlgI
MNHPTAGRVPNGAIVERLAPSTEPSGSFKLQLAQADFTTAVRIAQAINKRFPSEDAPPPARAENAALVTVTPPKTYLTRPVEFMAEVESLSVDADRRAKIIVNEKTGTIVLGKEVRISPVAILHGSLSVEVQTNFAVSQPAPFSAGRTTTVPETGVGVKEEKARNIVLKQGATVEELVRALLSIGSTPRDVIAILQNLRASGALEAELEVI